MKLKDYLHYYLGVTYWTDNSEGEVNPETLRFIYPMIEKGKSVQLHLRRLEDMTEDEKAEYAPGICWSYQSYRPDQFNRLLKEHFDLFGLINAGLAIDAKTITP